ncbi:PREDICTED: N-alpha-acetyltransferase 40 [Nicrophorus vespilloides]|uniref:N-alpha-acetyltransferase 40 n=1 Tax=Nicrophorus vespilloides TaxID=110193 RepID=A0ABM1N5K1_NICVS|nr:PREDICTED: N-alpha-acetyltransferase 40 [Nicrophorus vespilloides]
MGRKSTKGKEKRLARKEEQLRLSASKTVVDKANSLKDPLEPFVAFQKYNNNGLQCDLYIKKVSELDTSTTDWAFGLTKKNMQHKYENCSWGWSDGKKREELLDDTAWYLVALSHDGHPIGFSHFRFDIDEGIEVLYCYELQLENVIHRRGLGKFMMQILELIAFTNNMRKVVLTVLKNNSHSNFFKAINYRLDESSPMDDEDDVFPYEILSKINKKLALTNPLPVHDKPHHGHSHHQHQCCPGHH